MSPSPLSRPARDVLLWPLAMHAIMFGSKRAFHGLLRFTRKPLLSMGLTAARFDLLSVLLMQADAEDCFAASTLQSEVRRMLGVTASVVSRMLGSLEALGLVSRRRPEKGDRRQREVRLTGRGWTCIREAQQALLRAMKRLVYAAICFGHPRAWLHHLDTLERYLWALREYFGDRAAFSYWWSHPID